MATPFSEIYTAFLGKITSFDRAELNVELMEADMEIIMLSALPYFRMPKIPLAINKETKEFENDLTNDEIQIISVLMKREWYKRFIADAELLIQKYDTGDFEVKSQANHLKALVSGLVESLDKECKKMISNYDRIDSAGKLFDYQLLAGK